MNKKAFPSIALLKFPFELKKDQTDAVEAWVKNSHRGTIQYSTGTGKTEIAFECARRFVAYFADSNKSINKNNGLVVNSHQEGLNIRSTLKIVGNLSDLSREQRMNSDRPTEPESMNISFLNILFLVPRISLINQTMRRLVSYGIPEEKVGVFFGEKKDKKEILIATFNSVIRNPILIRRSGMIILDEVHLIKDSSKAFVKIFDYIIEDPNKAILGLTATLDEKDNNYSTILSIIPPVIKYPIHSAVRDRRLAKPIIIPIKVSLTDNEREQYEVHSTKIKNISNKFKRYDVDSMTMLLKTGGFASGMAKAWFSNVRKRKHLLSSAENKISAAIDVIANKFPNEKIMVFSETIESIEKLKLNLESKGIEAEIIDAKVRTAKRQIILDKWGESFNVLLSVHTLEIGYDVPQVRIEIILATTSNINQIVQRIGRVLRRYEGKDIALIYVIYVPDTKDDNVFEAVTKAVAVNESSKNLKKSPTQENSVTSRANITTTSSVDFKTQKRKTLRKVNKLKKDKLMSMNGIKINDKFPETVNNVKENRMLRAFQIVECSLKEKNLICNENQERMKTHDSESHDIPDSHAKDLTKLFKVKSIAKPSLEYTVDLGKMSCTCADYTFRKVRCKHILATELVQVDNYKEGLK